MASSSRAAGAVVLARLVGLGIVAGLSVAACGLDEPDTAADDQPGVDDQLGGGASGDDGSGATPAGPEPKSTTAPSSVVVERVIDGDSLELTVEGVEVEVRLLGVNAPELWTPTDQRSCPGEAARDHLESLLDSAGELGFRPGEEDRFGRLLGVLDVDGRPVTELMVADGWALALWSGEDEQLTASMLAAAEAGRGMWGDECGPPAAADLAISDHQADAPGDDRVNLGEEWVEVANNGSEPVDLDGWTIRDETTSNRFTISTLTVAPGDAVKFRSGPGVAGPGDYYLGEEFPVWSNGGETVLLVDPSGVLAAFAFIRG